VPEIVYDTGALVAAERRNPALWALHAELIAAGTVPLVPVPVLAQGWRGGPQQLMSRLLNSCHIVPMVEDVGRGAGAACAATGTSDVVDATVVVTAAMVGAAAIVTSDPDDLAAIANGLGIRLRMRAV
jgi:hypothetical protein